MWKRSTSKTSLDLDRKFKWDRQYGNTGCGVFKGGIQNQKSFWLKNHHTQKKLLNFQNWSSGELGIILENKAILKLKLSNNLNKNCAPKLIF